MFARYKKSVLFLLIGMMLWISGPDHAFAQNMDTPVLLQVATFVKVFKYDATLKDKSSLKLLIVYSSGNKTVKDELLKAFRDASVQVNAATLDELDGLIHEYDVIYLMPGVQSASGLCKQHKKLSISGLGRYAQDGLASVALGLVNDKPRLFVNLESLQEEGHTLSAKLLQVVQVFN